MAYTSFIEPEKAAKKTKKYLDTDRTEEFQREALMRAMGEYDADGYSASDEEILERAQPYYDELEAQVQSQKEEQVGALSESVLSGATRDYENTPSMQTDWDSRQREKPYATMLEEAIAKETDLDKQLELMSGQGDVDFERYGIDPYEYGQPPTEDPNRNTFGSKVFGGAMDVIDAPGRFLRGSKTAQIRYDLANMPDIDPEMARGDLAEFEDQRAREELAAQGAGGRDIFGNVPHSGENLEGYVPDDYETLGFFDKMKGGVEAVFSPYDDPDADLSKTSAQTEDWYSRQGILLAAGELGDDAGDEKILALAQRYKDMLWTRDDTMAAKNPEALSAGYGLGTDALLGGAGKLAYKGLAKAAQTGKGAARGIARNQAVGMQARAPMGQAIKEGIQGQKTAEFVGDEVGLNLGRKRAAEEAFESESLKAADIGRRMTNEVGDAETAYKHATGEVADPRLTGLGRELKATTDDMNKAHGQSGAAQRLEKYSVEETLPQPDQPQLDMFPEPKPTPVAGERGFEVKAPYRENYVPAEEFKQPKLSKSEAAIERATLSKRKVKSAEGIGLERVSKAEDIVPDIEAQFKASAKHKGQVGKSAFFKETYNALKKQGIVGTSDDFGITTIARATKKQTTGEIERKTLNALVKANPGTDFVKVPDILAKDMLRATLPAGSKISDKAVMFVPKEYYKAIENLDPKDLVPALDFFTREVLGPTTRIWKNTILGLNPAKYIGLNGAGNTMMTYTTNGISGVRQLGTAGRVTADKMKSEMYGLLRKDAKKLELYNKPLKTAKLNTPTVGEAVEYAKKFGLIDQSKARQGIHALKNPGKNPLKWAEKATNIATKPMFKGAEFFDESHRLGVFLAMIEDGSEAGMRKAAKDTLDIVGNFNKMNSFERNYMQHTVAFYSWRKHSAKWFAKNIVKNPDKFRQFKSFVDYYNAKVDPDSPLSHEDLANWIQGRHASMKMPGDEGDKDGRQVVLMPETPFGMGQDVLSSGMEDLYSPHVRAALIFATGFDTYTGKQVGKPGKGYEWTGPYLDLGRNIKSSSKGHKAVYDILLNRGDKTLAQAWKAQDIVTKVLMLKALGIPAQSTMSPGSKYYNHEGLLKDLDLKYKSPKKLKKELDLTPMTIDN